VTTLNSSKLAAINVMGLAALAGMILTDKSIRAWEDEQDARLLGHDATARYLNATTESIWPDPDHPKMRHGYQHDCNSCFGFGWWIGETIPVHETEARDGFESDPCPECGEDNAIYAHLHEKREEDMAAGSLPIAESVDEMLYKFEKELRCAELLVIQGQSE
jgi:hypothetical protein